MEALQKIFKDQTGETKYHPGSNTFIVLEVIIIGKWEIIIIESISC